MARKASNRAKSLVFAYTLDGVVVGPAWRGRLACSLPRASQLDGLAGRGSAMVPRQPSSHLHSLAQDPHAQQADPGQRFFTAAASAPCPAIPRRIQPQATDPAPLPSAPRPRRATCQDAASSPRNQGAASGAPAAPWSLHGAHPHTRGSSITVPVGFQAFHLLEHRPIY